MKITPIICQDFIDIIIPEINKAEKSIKIIVYDWRWYHTAIGSPAQKFNSAILQAHKRGVKIQVITNIKHVIGILASCGIAAKKIITNKTVHSKIMIIDDKDLVIGSHNYTQNAFTLNFETSVLITDFDQIQRFIDFFNTLYF